MTPDNITHASDPDGREVVGVRLSNAPDKTAWLYREDYERIAAQYPGRWSLVDARNPRSCVRLTKGHRSIYAARLVVDAPYRTAIGFFDNDTLNLRGTNISLGKGCGGVPKTKARKELCIPLARGGGRV
ncbi:hypothetical protein LRS73_28340 [Methylobacterium currus]|uniref:hypothetical protein n=1 Tax=Methylobacterium currus TaxID=2051553 RepID=UPI001E28EFDB|nr:hypothetical protein [Methylobacterium currus]UHC16315.1 hypothetical protein LRS73_28340 [Methylobacterium currus]